MKRWPLALAGAAFLSVALIIAVWMPSRRPATAPVAAGLAGDSAQARVVAFWETYRQATAYRVDGRFNEARDAYARALEFDPGHEDALYYLGNMQLELGDYAGARSAWERLVAVNDQSSRAHSRLGDLFACLDPGAPRDYMRAETEFRRALAINREETGPLLRLGEVMVLRGRLADAAVFLEAVIGSNHRSVEAHFLSGYLAWKQAAPEPAALLFRRAVELTREARAVQQAPGEGDTKGGLAPMVKRAARCRHFQAPLDGLSLVDLTSPAGAMERLYRQVDAEVAQSR